MSKLKRLVAVLGTSRWWAVFLTTVIFVCLTLGSILAFRASIGALAWLSAEQVWIRNREASVQCVEHMVEHREVSELERCREPFADMHRFATLKQQVEDKEWDAARETMIQLELQPNEVDAALGLFKMSRDIPLVGSAYEVWGAAIQEFLELEALAESFRESQEKGRITDEQQAFYLSQLHQIDRQVQRHESRFANLLADAQERAETVGIVFSVGAIVLLIALGMFYWRLAKHRERERSAVEQRLAVQERTFLALVENLREAVCAVDPKTGRVQYANPAFWTLTKYRPDDTLWIHDFIDVNPQEIDSYLNAEFEGKDAHREQRWIGRDGKVLTMQVLLTRTNPGTGGETLFFLARDVTEQREMEAHMMEVDRMAAVGTLAAGVGHEINNPLTFVAGGVDFARMELERFVEESEFSADAVDRLQQIDEALDDAQQGTRRVRDIVRDLKTFSRRDSEDTVEAIEVEPVLEMAIDMAASEIRHRAQLRRDYRANTAVLGNESRLAQVFLNLLINGAHAMEDGTVEENELGVTTYIEGDMVVVDIRDTGTGIPEDQHDMIFEPFRTTKPVDKGTGLGLAISRNIVESLGGSLDFTSTPGVETTFSIRLPMASADASVSQERAVIRQIGGSLSILIIDDEPALGRTLRRMLEQRGTHRIVSVESAEEALALLDDGESFDLIFCDLLMPQMTGIEFLEEIRAGHPDYEDRVVFMTGGAFTDRTRDFAETVPNLVLSKPFDLEEIAEVIEARGLGQPRPSA